MLTWKTPKTHLSTPSPLYLHLHNTLNSNESSQNDHYASRNINITTQINIINFFCKGCAIFAFCLCSRPYAYPHVKAPVNCFIFVLCHQKQNQFYAATRLPRWAMGCWSQWSLKPQLIFHRERILNHSSCNDPGDCFIIYWRAQDPGFVPLFGPSRAVMRAGKWRCREQQPTGRSPVVYPPNNLVSVLQRWVRRINTTQQSCAYPKALVYNKTDGVSSERRDMYESGYCSRF